MHRCHGVAQLQAYKQVDNRLRIDLDFDDPLTTWRQGHGERVVVVTHDTRALSLSLSLSLSLCLSVCLIGDCQTGSGWRG